MEYTAKWGPKGFLVSPTKIVPLRDLSTSFSVKSDNGNTTSGTKTTNTRGRELQSVSLSTLYVGAAGVDPRTQIAEWESLVGQSYPLYIAGERFGPQKLMLKSVNVSDILLTNTGTFLQCAVALSFEEYENVSTTKAKTTKTSTKTSSTASSASNSKAAEVYYALNTTASASDKAAKKP